MSYTNSDIMDKLLGLSLHLESVKTDVAVIKEQALKTNGRVMTIEQWMNGIQAIEQYKKENPSSVQTIKANTVIQGGWTKNEKLVGAVVALMLALASAVQWFAGGIKP